MLWTNIFQVACFLSILSGLYPLLLVNSNSIIDCVLATVISSLEIWPFNDPDDIFHTKFLKHNVYISPLQPCIVTLGVPGLPDRAESVNTNVFIICPVLHPACSLVLNLHEPSVGIEQSENTASECE